MPFAWNGSGDYLVGHPRLANADEFKFVDAWRKDPYDQSVQVMFADWLEEQGRINDSLLIKAISVNFFPLVFLGEMPNRFEWVRRINQTEKLPWISDREQETVELHVDGFRSESVTIKKVVSPYVLSPYVNSMHEFVAAQTKVAPEPQVRFSIHSQRFFSPRQGLATTLMKTQDFSTNHSYWHGSDRSFQLITTVIVRFGEIYGSS